MASGGIIRVKLRWVVLVFPKTQKSPKQSGTRFEIIVPNVRIGTFSKFRCFCVPSKFRSFQDLFRNFRNIFFGTIKYVSLHTSITVHICTIMDNRTAFVMPKKIHFPFFRDFEKGKVSVVDC